MHGWLVVLAASVACGAEYFDSSGRGEPALLIPGGCQTARVFSGFAPLLQPQFRTIAVTPPGCGPTQADAYGIDRHIDDLIALLDSLAIKRATFIGHSSGGGLVVRLARRHPDRVTRLVLLDPIYTGVPPAFEDEMEAAITKGVHEPLTLESHRRNFEAWELGTWSEALAEEFATQTEPTPSGTLRYRPRPKGWQEAFRADIEAGRYFETATTHPTLILAARDLDRNRVKRLASPTASLQRMAKEIGQARRRQMKAFQRNGRHVKVQWWPNASHYLFIDHAEAIARQIKRFAQRPPSSVYLPGEIVK